MDTQDIKGHLDKTDAQLLNLQDLIRSLTYRSSKFRNTDKEDELFELVDKILAKLMKTSYYAGSVEGSYPTWDATEKDMKCLWDLMK